MLHDYVADGGVSHLGTAHNTHLYLRNTAAPRGLLLLKSVTADGGGAGGSER